MEILNDRIDKRWVEKNVDLWMQVLVQEMKTIFGTQLLYVGLQGSCARGEMTAQSDIDIIMVLEELNVGHLEKYRNWLQSHPAPYRPCGFICGRNEILHWPRYELFPLIKSTIDYYQNILDLCNCPDRKDLKSFIQISAANLYHILCHTLLYDKNDKENILSFKKSVFYIIQVDYYLNTGIWLFRQKDLKEQIKYIEKYRFVLEEESDNMEEWIQTLLTLCSQWMETCDGEILAHGKKNPSF